MISIVTPYLDRPDHLCNMVSSLYGAADYGRAADREIIVVAFNEVPEMLLPLAPFVSIINVSHPFSSAWALNVGIKAAKYDYVLCVGCDMLFSENYTEILAQRLNPHKFILSECGFIATPPWTYSTYESSLAIAKRHMDQRFGWDKLCASIETDLSVYRSGTKMFYGALQCTHRGNYFALRGYNEKFPMQGADENMAKRALRYGLEWDIIKFEEAQLLHQWHEPSPLLEQEVDLQECYYGPMVCNPERWGDL